MPAVLAVLLPALFAGMLGYFMFWGRLSDVYMGVITLTVSLILFRFINSTSGDQWNIGEAPLGRLQRHPRHARSSTGRAVRRAARAEHIFAWRSAC